MKNSKKFSNVAKKSLAVALAVLSLTGGMQNVSAMRPTGTKLELNYLMNVMQNIHDKEMLKKFEQVSKKCGDTFEGTFMNPISVTKKNAEKFFPKLETQHFYSAADDKKYKLTKKTDNGNDIAYVYDYLWNESAAISNANFITRKDMDDKSFLEVDNCDIENENYKKPDTVKLSERESAIYKSIKKFILSDKADFNEFEPVYNYGKCFETIDSKTFKNGVECQIKEFTYRNKKPKAFVCVVVPDDGTFTKENMDTIKRKLSNQGLATRDGLQFDFENVNLVIRPKTRTAKFEIGEEAIYRCKNSTINAQGATISEKFPIFFDCKYSTINAQGATISGKDAISNCCDSTINAQGATISEKYAICFCFYSTINVQGATIPEEDTIFHCDNSTINAQGAKISGEHAFDNCGKDSTINVNEEQVSDANNKVCKSENVKINDRSSEEIKSEVKQQQPKEQIKTEAERTKVSKSDAASVNNSSEYYILEKSKEKIAKTSKSENKFSKQAVIGGVVGFLSICTITAVAFKNKIKKFFNQHIVKKDQKLNQKLTRVK